jgi:hypothetical protein
MGKSVSRIVSESADSLAAVHWVADMLDRTLPGGAVEIRMQRPEDRRSLDQNAKLWAMLGDVARQQQMVISGRLTWADPADWKDLFTAALRKELRMAQGIDGGLVVLGMRTSRMRKAEFADLIELIYAYGAEHGVQWSEPALAAFDEYREAHGERAHGTIGTEAVRGQGVRHDAR